MQNEELVAALTKALTRKDKASVGIYRDTNLACFVVTRDSDGHELSFSSVDSSVIEWDGSRQVTDHGWMIDGAHTYIAILAEFLAGGK